MVFVKLDSINKQIPQFRSVVKGISGNPRHWSNSQQGCNTSLAAQDE